MITNIQHRPSLYGNYPMQDFVPRVRPASFHASTVVRTDDNPGNANFPKRPFELICTDLLIVTGGGTAL